MFLCILYHYSKLLHKKTVAAQRRFDISTKRYGGKPNVSQTFYIDWLTDLTGPDQTVPDRRLDWTDWRFGKSCRAALFENEEKFGSKRKDQDKTINTQLSHLLYNRPTKICVPVLRFPAPLYIVRFSRKCVWNNRLICRYTSGIGCLYTSFICCKTVTI